MQVDIFKGHNVRTEVRNNKVWFALQDVLDVLQSGRARDIVPRLRENDRDFIAVIDSMGREQNAWFINERGLIRVLQTSRSPLVESFQDWADERVEQLLNGKTVNAAGVTTESEDALVMRAIGILQTRLDAQAKELETARPKAQAYDEFLGATGYVDAKQASVLLKRAGIDIGRNQLLDRLVDIGWTYRVRGGYAPNVRYENQGLLSGQAQTRPDWKNPGTRKLCEANKIIISPKGLHKLRAILLPPMDVELFENAA